MATPLPATSAFTGAAVDEGAFKARFAEMRNFMAGLLGTSGEPVDARKALGVSGNEVVYETSNYTLLPEDCGKTFVWTGSTARTAAFTSAATLGNGWTAEFVNKMSANLTLDPDIAELIDGITTYVVPPGGRAIVRCDGTGLILIGKIDNSIVSSFNGRQGAVTLTSGDVTSALGFTPSPNTHTHSYVPLDVSTGVGCFARLQSYGNGGDAYHSPGAGISGAPGNLAWGSTYPGSPTWVGYGTWRSMGYVFANSGAYGEFGVYQRIG